MGPTTEAALDAAPGDPLLRARLDQLTDVRRRNALKRPHQITRGVRRLLEHEWEHLREIRRRIAV